MAAAPQTPGPERGSWCGQAASAIGRRFGASVPVFPGTSCTDLPSDFLRGDQRKLYWL